MRWRVHITDDRGKRVPLAPHDWRVGVAGSEERKRLAAASALPYGRAPPHLDFRPTRGEVIHGILAGIVALPVLLAAALVPAYLAFNTRLPWWGTILAVLPTGTLPAVVTVYLARRLARRRIVRAYTHASLCASCSYDLKGLSPETDGCRICPECGAAWRPPPA